MTSYRFDSVSADDLIEAVLDLPSEGTVQFSNSDILEAFLPMSSLAENSSLRSLGPIEPLDVRDFSHVHRTKLILGDMQSSHLNMQLASNSKPMAGNMRAGLSPHSAQVFQGVGKNTVTGQSEVFSANAAELSQKRHKSSVYRGVSFNIKSQKWKSVITINKRQTFLGYYTTEHEAALKYDEYSRFHRGSSAKTNFGPNGLFNDNGTPKPAKVKKNRSQVKTKHEMLTQLAVVHPHPKDSVSDKKLSSPRKRQKSVSEQHLQEETKEGEDCVETKRMGATKDQPTDSLDSVDQTAELISRSRKLRLNSVCSVASSTKG